MFVIKSEQNKQSLYNTFHRCFRQNSVHLVKQFQRRFFLENQPIRNKNCLWRPCLLMDWNEINNLNRGPSIDASYQVRFILPSNPTKFGSFCQAILEEKIFRNPPTRNKKCLWWQCLLIDQIKKSNLHRVPAIDASYHRED
jgi:hypothetical protein